MSDIVVIGSLNIDMVERTAVMPGAGETLHGKEFHTIPGGKGANQALAIARLGGSVSMIGRVGQDGFGKALCKNLADNQVDITGFRSSISADRCGFDWCGRQRRKWSIVIQGAIIERVGGYLMLKILIRSALLVVQF